MYDLIFSTIALKKLDKLNKDIQKRIIRSLERILIRPESYVKRLVGSSYYGFRVGQYRIILDIQKNKLIIFVVTLGHRKSIYEKIG
tara:strand:+ start:1104 stop:1361 length:258 start_codon:yes stop_codon:yes gene_type:complete